MISQLVAFLSGQTRPITDDLQTKMRQAAGEKKFELAARYRNRLQDIAKLNSPQQIIGKRNVSYDIISIWQAKNKKAVNIFKIRTGRLTDKITITLVTKETDPGEILEQFISQYYGQSPDIPPEILTSHPVQIKAGELSYLTKKNVKIKTPQKGRLKNLVNLGMANAASYLEQIAPAARRQKNTTDLEKLQSALSLPTLPRRIEAYDIANIQGQYAVGSMVVLTNGQPDKKEYRRFRIKYTSGINDTAMLAEVLYRRFANHPTWPAPDLLLLDGGKGQASAAAKTLANLKINIPLAALAKKDEIIYLLRKNNHRPKSKNSPKWKYNIYKLTKNLPPLSLLQSLRDEAHRTANSFYQQQHHRGQTASKLDEIPGIGPKTKIKLQRKYGGLADLKSSNYADLSKIIGKKKAALIKNYLK
jgi:excinuclease ABC subunit C